MLSGSARSISKAWILSAPATICSAAGGSGATASVPPRPGPGRPVPAGAVVDQLLPLVFMPGLSRHRRRRIWVRSAHSGSGHTEGTTASEPERCELAPGRGRCLPPSVRPCVENCDRGSPGRLRAVSLEVRGDLLNGHRIAQAARSSRLPTRLRLCLQRVQPRQRRRSASIVFLGKAEQGQTLVAEGWQVAREGRAGVTRVSVKTADGRDVAEFTGYSRPWAGAASIV